MWTPWNKPEEVEEQPRTPKQERLITLILTLKEQLPLPPMAQVMVSNLNLSALFNQLDDERIDAIITQLKEVIVYVEDGGEQPYVADLTQ